MSGIGAKLPLNLDTQDGIGLTKTVKETIRQNLKMLVLTSPGERLMLPDYGIGVRNFLFEQNSAQTKAHLTDRVIEQVATYMPFIEIENIIFSNTVESDSGIQVIIEYSAQNAASRDSLTLDL